MTQKIDSKFTETEISNTLKKRIPANTSSNTSFAMNTYRKWVEFRNRQPETALDPYGPFVPVDCANSDYRIIDYWLGIFVLEARRNSLGTRLVVNVR